MRDLEDRSHLLFIFHWLRNRTNIKKKPEKTFLVELSRQLLLRSFRILLSPHFSEVSPGSCSQDTRKFAIYLRFLRRHFHGQPIFPSKSGADLLLTEGLAAGLLIGVGLNWAETSREEVKEEEDDG